jgi:hypothetical protein
MKKISIIACAALLASCYTVKTIPIKGTYLRPPYTDTATIAKEQAWDKIIDFFAQNGLSIKIIDKSSGLIISDHTAVPATYESKLGIPEKKDAWIVLPKRIDPNSRKPFPIKSITGEWNIRIKELPDKRTFVNVNLVNLTKTENSIISTGGFKTTTIPQQVAVLDFKSTGLFEKTICEMIKN